MYIEVTETINDKTHSNPDKPTNIFLKYGQHRYTVTCHPWIPVSLIFPHANLCSGEKRATVLPKPRTHTTD